MIALPDVTLVVPTTRAHELTRITVTDLVSKVEFGEVLIYTDSPDRLAVPGARYVQVADWPNKRESGAFYYTKAALGIGTSHALLMEWDAGACDPAMWRDEFLQYDYIGAPWGTGMCRSWPGFMVGNGGFALVTKRLVEFCDANRFPISTDMHISCNYRAQCEAAGFKWAPETVARDFAYEGWTARGPIIPTVRPASFGYHCVTNWPSILTREDLLHRANLLVSGSHGHGKIGMLLRAAPWLNRDLGISYPSLVPLHRTKQKVDLLRAQRSAIIRGNQQRGMRA